jgi:hypothetical protein
MLHSFTSPVKPSADASGVLAVQVQIKVLACILNKSPFSPLYAEEILKTLQSVF